MFVVIAGAGRVGSSVARELLVAGHQVSCLDEDPDALARLEVGLDTGWEDAGGTFTVGTALEDDAMREAGIERADVFVAATNGDNTNIVVAQIVSKRFEVPKVVARILDPLRAQWYATQGMETICPTQVAIDMLGDTIRDYAAVSGESPA
ncbi:MAG: potassium channel family protein [Solirubrobacterales bacterium]